MKRLLLSALLVISGFSHAGFIDGTTDQVSSTTDEPKRQVPPDVQGGDITASCVAHLREKGFSFYDKADMEMANYKELVARAELIKPIVNVEKEIVLVEASCPVAPKPVKKNKKQANKKPTPKAMSCS
ncbi:hypothetical protein R6242_19365 [Iodobacter sp. CM08]|uniref:hypothetical protein n=1 Tax=Iodobacter sp. CM08 TaxID=3085902 RepID=UPI002981BABD|nr:hypothetical protein [Iodobacter sp. CM08]MDW5418731.1 hypothetical protein [Iodobacter sp. CM08]